MIESLVGMALLGLVFVAIMTVWTTSWRTEQKAMADSHLQRIGRLTLHTIVNGDTLSNPPVHGLIKARQAMTNESGTALAYVVTWFETVDGSQVQHDDEVSIYLSDGRLYRYVETFVEPLNLTTTGGTEIAGEIASLGVTIAASPTGKYLIQLDIVVGDQSGDHMVFKTGISPRNWSTGG
jgi:type II secretory pathway pseudopilin PulG